MSTSAYSTTLTASPLRCTGRLLDNIPKAGSPIALAYSVRRVSTSYKGPCMRVRRTSDNTEQDIFFIQTYIDIASLKKFAFGFDAYVTVWYDQSGRGRNATQTVPTLQPIVVRDGEVIFDTKLNQVTVEFNGAFMMTDWEPVAADATNGMGILAVSSVGLRTPGSTSTAVSPQPGVVTVYNQTGLAVTTDFPEPPIKDLLPSGYASYLFEGLDVIGADDRPEVLYLENANIHHLSTNSTTGVVTKTDSQKEYPSGPSVLTVDTISDGMSDLGRGEKWRRGIRLSNGNIYAIPYRASNVLEINPVTRVIRKIALPVDGATNYENDTSGKYWMAVASEDKTKAFGIPYSADKVLRISINAGAAEISYIGDALSSGGEKWRDAVLVPTSSGGNGRIYAMPYKSARVLEIDPATSTVRSMGANAYGEGNLSLITTGTQQYFNYAAVVGAKAYGIPWAAATVLVIDTSTNPVTMSFFGTTGMTPYLGSATQENARPALTNGGRGYVQTPLPSITVSAPEYQGAGATTMTITPTVSITSHFSGIVRVTNPGDGYVESPQPYWDEYLAGEGTNYVYPKFFKSTPFGGANATMEAVDPVQPNLDGKQRYYRVKGLAVEDAGDGLFAKKNITFLGGKGVTAQAQATVTNGQVAIIKISDDGLPGSGSGSGYTSNPTVKITGGGGTGAEFIVEWDDDVVKSNRTPIVYSDTGGFLTSVGGKLKGSLKPINLGRNYTSNPTITFIGGRGTTNAAASIAAADTIIVEDGKITKINVTNGGTGYTVNPAITVTIQTPGQTNPPGNPGGTTATAEIFSVNASGAITGIRLKNCGSGYVAVPNVTVAAPQLPGGTTATATAVFTKDGRITGVNTAVQGTCYTRDPAVAFERGDGGRQPDEGFGVENVATTPGLPARIGVWLEGISSSTDASPYRMTAYQNTNSRMPRGTDKFSAPFVAGTIIYCLPYWTHRILEINTSNKTLTDVLPSPRTGQVLISPDFGVAKSQYVAGVSVARGSTTVFYGIPSSGRKQILKITPGIGAQYVGGPTQKDLEFNGGWNSGVLAFNGVIYCVPSAPNVLLVIDTKQDEKSEAMVFSNIKSPSLNKWLDIVAAGDSSTTGILYGIPADLDVVLEVNPGAALRRKSLPATGCVLAGKKKVVFSPVAGNVAVYDVNTKTIAKVSYPSALANVSYMDGVQIADGNVIWVPTYNQTDTFVYTGNIGVFNPVTNTFTTSANVPIELAAPFPSRSACGLGLSTNEGKVVSWIPRGTTRSAPPYSAIATYNHQETSKAVEEKGERQEVSVSFASAQRIGENATATNVVATIPSVTTVVERDTYPVIRAGGGAQWKFSGSVLVSKTVAVPAVGATPATTRKELVVVLVPGIDSDGFSLFYPDDRTASANVTVESPTAKVTLIETPETMLKDFQRLRGNRSLKFRGGVLGADDKVYCVPWGYTEGVVVIDPVYYGVSEIRKDLNFDLNFGSLYWGGVRAGNNKIYFVPHAATKVLVVDPSIENPVNRISFIDLPAGYQATYGKWAGCCLTSTGKILCAPYGANAVLVIDPETSQTSVACVAATWITDATGGRFSGCAAGGDGKVYMIPFDAEKIVTLDPENLSAAALKETSTRVTGANKWSDGVVAPNGRLYLIPCRTASPLEYDPVTDTVTLLSSKRDNAFFGTLYGSMVLLPDESILAFPIDPETVLDINTDGQYIAVYEHNFARWNKCGRVPYQYRLRPFPLVNNKSVFFHTGNAPYALFNSESATANTKPVYGSKVRDGVAVHYPNGTSDTIRSYRDASITEIIPSFGGIAGVKSYSGKADLEIGVTNGDLTMRIGNGATVVQTVFDNIYVDGAPGVLSSYLDTSKESQDLYLQTTLLGGVGDVGWTGRSGNTFSVGRVVGSPQAELNAPEYTRSFSGSISELAVFSSNQQSRAIDLADNSAFFFGTKMRR